MADIPTSKNFLPELEFASYEIDKVKQFNDYVIQAKKIITERLPVGARPKRLITVQSNADIALASSRHSESSTLSSKSRLVDHTTARYKQSHQST